MEDNIFSSEYPVVFVVGGVTYIYSMFSRARTRLIVYRSGEGDEDVVRREYPGAQVVMHHL